MMTTDQIAATRRNLMYPKKPINNSWSSSKKYQRAGRITAHAARHQRGNTKTLGSPRYD